MPPIVRVMKFGVRKVISGQECLLRESSLAHTYYNQLIAIRRDGYKKYCAIREGYIPGFLNTEELVHKLDEEIAEIHDEIRLTRKLASKPQPPQGPTPTKTPATEEQKARIDALKAQRKEVYKTLSGMRKEFKDMEGGAPAHLKELLKPYSTNAIKLKKPGILDGMYADPQWHQAWKDTAALNHEQNLLSRAARDAINITEGTYASTEAAVATASKTSFGNPEFRRWNDGEGMRKVGRQMEKGKLMMQVKNGGSKKIDVLSMTRRRPHASGNRARAQLWRVRMTLAKGLGDIEVDVTIHRPIPDDAVITWVYLVPHRNNKWSLQFTMNLSEPLITRAVGTGLAHLDLRWSLTKDRGLVVGLLTTEHGTRTLEVPPETVSGLEYCDRIKGYNDVHFNDARAALKQWTTLHKPPEWMVEQIEHISLWKSHKKLVSVSKQWITELALTAECKDVWGLWKSKRLGADLDLFCQFDEYATWAEMLHINGEVAFAFWLDTWRRKEAHLKAIEIGRGDRLRAHRKNLFRNYAAQLCTEFETIEFGALNLPGAARRKTPDKDQNELHQTARKHRGWASPGLLKECLRATFGDERCLGLKKKEDAR